MCPIPKWATQRPSSTVSRRCYCSTLASLWGEMGACNKDCSNYWSTTSRVLTESYCWGMVCMSVHVCVVHHPKGTLRASVTRNLCSWGFVCPTTGVKKKNPCCLLVVPCLVHLTSVFFSFCASGDLNHIPVHIFTFVFQSHGLDRKNRY